MISPLESTSMFMARVALGRLGMSIIAPEVATRNPAPAESDISVTRSVQPVGAPILFGSSESEYWVFAMQTGKCP